MNGGGFVKVKCQKAVFILIGVILITMLAFNFMVKDFEVKSEDGKWSVHFVHFFRWDYPDHWEGYLFYPENEDGDIGEIDWKSESGNVFDKVEPESFSEITNMKEKLAIGLSAKEKVYYGPGISHDETCGTITVYWEEEGQSMSAKIDVDGYVDQTHILKRYLKSQKLFEILFRRLANV